MHVANRLQFRSKIKGFKRFQAGMNTKSARGTLAFYTFVGFKQAVFTIL
jgi:hypothetical protein